MITGYAESNAAATFREHIKIAPQSAEAYLYLGVVLQQQKKTDEARQALEKAEAQMNGVWEKSQRPLQVVTGSAAGPLSAEATYLLALAKHEQAELSEARKLRRPNRLTYNLRYRAIRRSLRKDSNTR